MISPTAAMTLSQPTIVSQKDSDLIWFSAATVNGIRLNPPDSGMLGTSDMMSSSHDPAEILATSPIPAVMATRTVVSPSKMLTLKYVLSCMTPAVM